MIRRNVAVTVGAALCSLVMDSAFPSRRPPASPVYVFGDSLSDVGNLYRQSSGAVPPATRYFEGRFCDGPVWVETLVEELTGKHLLPSTGGFQLDAGDNVSFAYGGAGTGLANITPDDRFTVPGMLGQVDLYRRALAQQGVPVPAEAMAVVCGGANDYLFAGNRNPLVAVRNLARTVRELHALGMRRFLVPNLPNLGATPVALALGVHRPLSALSRIHNLLLRISIRRLARTLPQARLVHFDAHSLLLDLVRNPGAHGFTGTLTAGPAAGCLLPPFDCSPVQPNGSLFWDEVHPAASVHRFVGEHACRALS